nr:DUF1501 domain-containing protein [Verrucomicrobiota bacterium]
MIKIIPNTYSRRSFLQVGALAPLGLSLPALYASESRPSVARAKSVILIFLGGGISHHDSFDPKPDAVEDNSRRIYHQVGTKTANAWG